jgi:hypothetical protein
MQPLQSFGIQRRIRTRGQQASLAKRKLQASEQPLTKKAAIHGPLLEDGKSAVDVIGVRCLERRLRVALLPFEP